MNKFFTLLLSVFLMQVLQAQTVKTLWSVCGYDINPIPTDMAVDITGNSYITGYFQDTTYNDYLLTHFFLQKTSANGTVQWIRYYPAADSFDAGKSVATDHLGNVYVTGQRYDTVCNICTIQTPHSYLFTIKYDSLGNMVWINNYDGPPSTNQVSSEISVSRDGMVYVVANEKKYDPVQGRTINKMLTQKIFRNGSTAWIRKDPEATGNGITYDKDGNVLVAASWSPAGIYQLNKFYTVKYSKSGALLWAKTISEYQKNGNAYFIYTDGTGNVYVNGQTDTITFYNNPRIITAKYSPGGNLLWLNKELNATYTLPNFYGNYTIDNKGNSYITGYLKVSDVDRDYLTVKRDTDGKLIWSSQYIDSIHGPSVPLGIGVGKDQSVYVTGYTYRSNYYITATIGYSNTGVQQWLKYYSRTPASNNFPIGLGLDTSGNIYVGGSGVCTIKYGVNSRSANLERAIVSTEKIEPFTVFPNPCRDVLFISSGVLRPAKCTYTIYDITGRVMVSSTMLNNETKGNPSINVKNLKTGLYILLLSDGKINRTQKFSKL